MGRSYHSGENAAPEDPSKPKKNKKTAEELAKGLQKNPTHRAPGKGSDVWDEGVKKVKKALGLD